MHKFLWSGVYPQSLNLIGLTVGEEVRDRLFTKFRQISPLTYILTFEPTLSNQKIISSVLAYQMVLLIILTYRQIIAKTNHTLFVYTQRVSDTHTHISNVRYSSVSHFPLRIHYMYTNGNAISSSELPEGTSISWSLIHFNHPLLLYNTFVS